MSLRSLFGIACAFLIHQGNGYAESTPPKVLILGDDFHRRMMAPINADLNKAVSVVFQPTPHEEAAHTINALAKIDTWLGSEKWDLIYFNFGLVDLTHRAPRMESFRALSEKVGGVRTTSPETYAKNLEAIVKRLKQTGAKIIWANIPPIRSDSKGLFKPGSEVEYNAIAAKIMNANQVQIVDMHTWLSEKIKETKPQNGEPYSQSKGIELHPPVVAAIRKALKLNPSPALQKN